MCHFHGTLILNGICSTADQALSTPGHGRGRKQTTTNRSRQQLQRERALKLGAQVAEGIGTLPPEQKLSHSSHSTPPKLSATVAPVTGQSRKDESVTVRAAAVEPVTVEEDAVNNHDPEPSKEGTPMAKELDKQEVELLVSLLLSSEMSRSHELT